MSTGGAGMTMAVRSKFVDGNITNTALLSLFELHLDAIAAAFDAADFVEVGPDSLVVHRRRNDCSAG